VFPSALWTDSHVRVTVCLRACGCHAACRYSSVSVLTFAGGITVNVGQMRMLVYLTGVGWVSPS
jgi:hypothetical protein